MRAHVFALVLFAQLAAVGPAVAAQPASLAGFAQKIEATKQAMMGDPAVARRAAEDAVAYAGTLKNDPAVPAADAAVALATARWLLGEALIGLNQAPKAKPLIAQALGEVEAHRPGSKLHGDLLRSRATLSEMEGALQPALKDYVAAYRIFKAIGEARSCAIALQDIGNLYLEAADFDRVRSYYSQSLEAYAEDPWLNLATYNNRGQAFREQRRYREAEAEYRLALKSARQLESPLLEARILTNLAETQYELGALGEASATLAAADRLAQRGEAAGWRPFVTGVRAMVEAKRGNTADAGRLMHTAFAGQDFAKTEMPYRELHQAAAEIYERLGDSQLALAHAKAFQRLDGEALRLTASASAQLMSAQFDFANQNLRISQLKQGQLQRDVTIERQRTQFRTRLLIGLGVAGTIIFTLLGFGFVSIRRSRDRVRAANVELSASNEALGKALQARTDFLATTSHEIRTPLNGILGMTQVLLADRGLRPDVRERIELLQGAGDTMKTLVDDILDVAKMEAGEASVELGDVDLARAVGDCVGLWREAAASKNLALACEMIDAPAVVRSDDRRLRQVLSNLLSNAVKFTPAGEVTLIVRSEGERLLFAVRDTGVGIPAEEQARIFEAFTQVNNSTTREFSGTGLGLAISHRLAQALGGELSVESAPGEGSCFTLALPLEAVGDGLAQLATGSAALAHSALLLIDGNTATHALMRMLLTPETRSVEVVASVEEALPLTQATRFDHFVIEGSVGLDGIRTLIAAAGAGGAKASLLAAPSEELSAAQLFAAGADQVILKPIGAGDLIASLKKVYDGPAAAAEAQLRQAG